MLETQALMKKKVVKGLKKPWLDEEKKNHAPW